MWQDAARFMLTNLAFSNLEGAPKDQMAARSAAPKGRRRRHVRWQREALPSPKAARSAAPTDRPSVRPPAREALRAGHRHKHGPTTTRSLLHGAAEWLLGRRHSRAARIKFLILAGFLQDSCGFLQDSCRNSCSTTLSELFPEHRSC